MLPSHIKENLSKDKDFYSLYNMENIEKCKTDDKYLGDVLIANEDLIWHSVHKYIGKPEMIVKNNCIEKDDILQLGRLGFIKAIHAFDTKRGVKFSSFAVTAIVREIRCFLRDSGSIIRPTRTANELIYKIYKIEQELEYSPTVEDLAELLGEPLDKIIKAKRIGRSVRYLDEPISNHGEEGSCSMIDFIQDEVAVEDEALDKVYVDSILDAVKDILTKKELSILEHRINGLNQTQTAEKEDVSQMRVSRIMKKVARLLKEHNIVDIENE